MGMVGLILFGKILFGLMWVSYGFKYFYMAQHTVTIVLMDVLDWICLGPSS